MTLHLMISHSTSTFSDLPASTSNHNQLRAQALAAARDGHDHAAIAYLTAACRIEPHNAHGFASLGTALSRGTRDEEATAALLRAISLGARTSQSYVTLARVLVRRGALAMAEIAYRESLAIDPSDERVHVEFGDFLCRERRLSTAMWHATQSLSRKQHADGHRLMGRIHGSSRDWSRAAKSYRLALEIDPACHEASVGLGQALLRLGNVEEALRVVNRALSIDASHVPALRLLVSLLEFSDSRGDRIEAWLALGAALVRQHQARNAVAAFQAALERKPDSLRGLLGLGRAFMILGQAADARQTFDAAAELDPSNVDAHLGLSSASHLLGDLERGWFEVAGHPTVQRYQWRGFEQPVWDGSPLDSRTLLIWAAGALGDTLHFLRYVPLAAARGGTVVVECPKRLVPLVERMPGVDRAVCVGAPLPRFDVHQRLTRLPFVFRTSLSTVPNEVPYVRVDEQLVGSWRERLRRDHAPSVGISWAGSPTARTGRERSVALAAFGVLAGIKGVRYVSLQMGPQRAELIAPPTGLHVDSLQDESCSILDTAALMMSLDLVITVDTMIAHLAGALARPVWVLLPHVADWRWFMDREDSPWYPTMRLFRQTSSGDWYGVFTRVRTALTLWVDSRSRQRYVGNDSRNRGAS